MNEQQIEQCRIRNQQLEQDIQAGSVQIPQVQQAHADINSLLIALEIMTDRARAEQEENQRLRNELADVKREKRDLQKAVGPLRDKLSKARKLIKTFNLKDLTPGEKEDLKDIMRDET